MVMYGVDSYKYYFSDIVFHKVAKQEDGEDGEVYEL